MNLRNVQKRRAAEIGGIIYLKILNLDGGLGQAQIKPPDFRLQPCLGANIVLNIGAQDGIVREQKNDNGESHQYHQ